MKWGWKRQRFGSVSSLWLTDYNWSLLLVLKSENEREYLAVR